MKKKIDELCQGGEMKEQSAKALNKELESLLMMRNEVKKPVGNLVQVAKEEKPKVIEKIVEKVVEVEKIVEVEKEKIVEVEKKSFTKEEILNLVQQECDKDGLFLNRLVSGVI